MSRFEDTEAHLPPWLARPVGAMGDDRRVTRYVKDLETDLKERLADERIVFLWGPIWPGTTGELIMLLLYLQHKAGDRDIHMYINSPGGAPDDTLAIYDTMQYLECDVCTYCVGQAARSAALILASGAKGKRYTLPHSRIMIHQLWGGVGGQAADVKIQAEEILKSKRIYNEILARHTGRAVDQVHTDTERDRYLSPAEAKEYGLVDEILSASGKKGSKE